MTEVRSNPEPDPETLAAIVGAVETFLAEELRAAVKPVRGTMNSWKMASWKPFQGTARPGRSWKATE